MLPKFYPTLPCSVSKKNANLPIERDINIISKCELISVLIKIVVAKIMKVFGYNSVNLTLIVVVDEVHADLECVDCNQCVDKDREAASNPSLILRLALIVQLDTLAKPIHFLQQAVQSGCHREIQIC